VITTCTLTAGSIGLKLSHVLNSGSRPVFVTFKTGLSLYCWILQHVSGVQNDITFHADRLTSPCHSQRRSAPLWDVTQRRVVIVYRRFGITSVPSSRDKKSKQKRKQKSANLVSIAAEA
jgi:hypothetical protein